MLFRKIWTKEELERIVTQEDILDFYYGLQIGDIIQSPFRSDKRPSFGAFMGKDGNIIVRDFGTPYCKGLYNSLKDKLNIDTTESLLSRIYEDMILRYSNFVREKRDKRQQIIKHSNKREKAQIDVLYEPWRKETIEYWKNLGVTESTLEKYKVKPCKIVYVNEKPCFTSKQFSMIFSYYFLNGERKIYIPSPKSFLTNSSKIQGWLQLDREREDVLITKSMKDIMVLYELGYNPIAPQAEGNRIIEEEVLSFLRTKTITILYDNDKAGIEAASNLQIALEKELVKECKVRFFSDVEAKDAAGHILKYGKEKTVEILKTLLD